jgi:stage II sporulation protein D
MPTHYRRRTAPRGTPVARRPAFIAVLLVMLLAATVAAPFSALAETPGSSTGQGSAATTGAMTVDDTVTFYGRGYGHGVGMSQYGARGRAQAGEDAATILAHYYQGATLAAIDPATRIRVLVLSKWVASAVRPLVVYGRLTPWSIDGVIADLPADARLRLFPPAASPGTAVPAGTPWRLLIEAIDGVVLFDGPAPADFTIRGATADGRIQLWSKPTRYDQYRGALRVIVQSTTRVSVVNDLTLEEYLAGVVPVEMPSTWPAAALQAQSIAARSYAARRLRPGVSYFDVPDGSSSQIYRGIVAEKPTTTAAIGATAGTVLMSGPTIINALFHSTGGGATESNENVYTSATGKRTGKPVSYLRGAPDRRPDGTPFDSSAPYAAWATRTYSRAQLSAWFAADRRTNVGDLLAIDLQDRGVSGRLVSVTLVGSAGTRTVSGEVFRAVFNKGRPSTDPSLRSTLVDTVPIP